MENAVVLLVKQKSASQFQFILGKEFHKVAKEHSHSENELCSLMFDYVLSLTGLSGDDGAGKLVATLKYPEPRVTLLLVRKQACESMLLFRQNFVAQAMRYLINKQGEKSLELVMSVEQEC